MELRIGDRDPLTGLYDVIFPDGSFTRNGVKIFNSEHQFGDVVVATQRSDGMMILDGLKAVDNSALSISISSATLSSIRLGGDSGRSGSGALLVGGFGFGNGNGGSGSAGYLSGQVFNDEEEVLGTYVKIEVVVFRSPVVVTTGEPRSLGIHPTLVDPHLFLPGTNSVWTGTIPGTSVVNVLPNPFSTYGISEPGLTTEYLYESQNYELVLVRYYAGYFEPPIFVDMLYADFMAGQRPDWWVVDDFLGQSAVAIQKEWFEIIRTTEVVSPPPLEFGAMAFYVEDGLSGDWLSSPSLAGKVFPITSGGVHELQLDPSKFAGGEITIHCVPVSPPAGATFGLRTETIKRRQPYSLTASSPTPLAATSNTLTDEVLVGSPANSKTAFIVTYNKGTRQFA